MEASESISGQDLSGPNGGRTRQAAVGAAAGLALAIVLWGGYSHHWPWTGINGGTATLWDWLHLLMLPLAFAVLPIWFSRETRVSPRTKAYGFAVLSVFVLLVILGYTIPWQWTGFRGNTLWDWFGLIILPLTLMLMPRLLELRQHWQPRHSAAAGTLLTVFIALVIGGYVGSWTWTGFTGNTLWNWMNLLFLPLLLPTVILPALKPIATGRVVYLDQDGKPVQGPASKPVQGSATMAEAPTPQAEAAGARTATVPAEDSPAKDSPAES
jgi:hypothetical protein